MSVFGGFQGNVDRSSPQATLQGVQNAGGLMVEGKSATRWTSPRLGIRAGDGAAFKASEEEEEIKGEEEEEEGPTGAAGKAGSGRGDAVCYFSTAPLCCFQCIPVLIMILFSLKVEYPPCPPLLLFHLQHGCFRLLFLRHLSPLWDLSHTQYQS